MSESRKLLKSDPVVKNDRASSWLADYLPPILLFSIALGLRAYRLTYHPLWLDEIYGFLIGQRGLVAVLQNSLHDPHPPLYYLFQWVASGFGNFRSELAWRWPSVLFGSLTVPLVYVNASKIANRSCAFLVAGLLAISPAHLFYSQEARAFAFNIFLAALSPLLIWRIRRNPQGKGAWLGLAILTVIGMYSSYSYLYIGFIQMAYLAILFPKSRSLYLYSGVVAIAFLPLVMPMFLSLGGTLEYHASTPVLTLFRSAQSLLAGEPIRYGLTWYHYWLPLVLGIFVVPGFWVSLKRHEAGYAGPYFVLQLLFPLVMYALGAGLGIIRLPISESKQFLNILPALFITIAAGLYFFQQRLPTLAFIIVAGCLTGIVIAGSFSGVKRYWSITKSPEGLAVLSVKKNFQEGDAIVSTHYSLDAALSFYYPNENVYGQPRIVGDQIFLSDLSYNRIKPDSSLNFDDEFNLENIRKHSRLWLLTHPARSQSVNQEIAQDCDRVEVLYFPPFQVELLVNCTN